MESFPLDPDGDCLGYEHCTGLFVDGETLAVTRCNQCQRFETDEDAAACVDALIDLLRRVGRQIKADTVADAFDELVKRANVGDQPDKNASEAYMTRELTHAERVIDLFADWRSNYRPGGPTGGTEGERHDACDFIRFVAKTIGVSSTDLRRIAKQNDSDARREL